ncbi:MAG: MFS transporter [Thermoanaerobaculia bacterium]
MEPPQLTAAPVAPPVRKREIFGWAMFDFANSSFTTLIVTVAYSVYFTKLVAPGDRADLLWGVGLAVSNLLVVLLAPAVGAAADASGRKKAFLFATYLICVAGTLALWWVRPGAVVLGLILFIIADVGFALGGGLISAFLPEIATPRTMGRISGLGWGLGYFGGLACLMLVRPLLAGGFEADNLQGLRLTWVVTGLFFLIAGIPTFVLLRERASRRPLGGVGGAVRSAYLRIRTTGHSLRHFSELTRFLGVALLAASGLSAVIAFSAVYAERTIGFSPEELILLFIALQLTSAAGALGCGFLQDWLGGKRTIALTLLLWFGVCLSAATVTTQGAYWIVALVAGLGIGSLQSTVRAVVGLLSPPEKSGEFFGFWSMAGQIAGAVGPLAFGLISSLTGSQRQAVVVIAMFFLASLVGLFRVSEERGRAAAEAWRERS